MNDAKGRSRTGPVTFGDPRLKVWQSARKKPPVKAPPPDFDLKTLQRDRARALNMAWISASLFVMLVARPAGQAFELGAGAYFLELLAFQYRQDPTDIVMPGLIWAVIWGGPVWGAMRLWIGHQNSASLGGRPATLRSFVVIWALSAVAYQLIFLDDAHELSLLSGTDDWPIFLEVAVRPDIVAHMAGVALLFAIYRWRRPRDQAD